MARAQKLNEMKNDSWMVPVAVGLPIGACVLSILGALLVYRDYKMGKMLQESSWKVNSEDIDMSGESIN